MLSEGRPVFGRRPKPRAAKLFARGPETALEKSPAPRVFEQKEQSLTLLKSFNKIIYLGEGDLNKNSVVCNVTPFLQGFVRYKFIITKARGVLN